jgi:alpha-galactosidase
MSAPPLASLEGAGRLEPVRIGLRFAPDPQAQGSGGGDTAGSRLETAPFAPGRLRLGAFALGVSLDHAGASATCEVVVRNVGDATARLDALVLGLRWSGHSQRPTRFLRHGWQSWSETVGRPLDPAGDPPFPSGPWLRAMLHALPELPPDRSGWHESHLVSVAGASDDGPACLAGILEREGFGCVYLRPTAEGVEVEVEIRLEVPLRAGEERAFDPIHVAVGRDANALLESFAELLGRRSGARTASPFQAGWCSWYHFFHGVTEEALRRNLDALAAGRGELPIQVVQLDDGYQRAIGDWLETNEKFPSGLVPLASAIRDAGFRPGIWTAPFCLTPESRLFRSHPDWLLRRGGEPLRGLHHAQWSKEGWVFVLDASRDEVAAHLLRTAAALAAMGFTYQKLDFLYTQAMPADAADPRLSRAARLRRGLQAIRDGAGAEAFLLGCGCPLGPAVGVVDGMRVGPDVAPHWDTHAPTRVAGLEPTQPSTRNALRNVLARVWMHRRLWLNDPDCLMARGSDTGLRRDEIHTLAATIAATGGMVLFSDDVPVLDEGSRALVRESIRLARAVDAADAVGTARALHLLADGMPGGVLARARGGPLVLLLNGSDAARDASLDLAELGPSATHAGPEVLLDTTPAARDPDMRFEVPLAPHASALLRLRAKPGLAVFCDFDGTFAVQDVGSTIARRYAGDRRPALWAQLEQGLLGAWEYNLKLLDGLRLPERELEEFLRTIELSPGARELVAWCEARGVPFRVLSDGFDYNLDRLQALHGIRFEYDANHLRYEEGAWRIEARHPNPACECGTGTCKRLRIEQFRAEHPALTVVHIGNGRVSDLCAALAADVVFAKDSLAEELARRGLPFEPFETLLDVLPGLERVRQRA